LSEIITKMIDSKSLLVAGLDEKSAQIYLASLSSGVSSVQQLAEKTGLKRPTVYMYIQQMLKEGFLEKVPIGKKDYYQAIDPEVVKQKVDEAHAQMQTIFPELLQMQNKTAGKPGVKVLVGKKGMEQIYKEIAQADSIRFWTDLSQFESTFKNSFNYLSETIKTKQIRTKEIIADNPKSKASSKRYAANAGKFYSSRIATKEGITNDSAIYGNVVALFRIHDFNLFVVRIEDLTIATSMKALFEMAWQSATPFIG